MTRTYASFMGTALLGLTAACQPTLSSTTNPATAKAMRAGPTPEAKAPATDAPTSGRTTYNIGTPAQILALYPDKAWLPPYYASGALYQNIAATVEMFTKQSLQRDGIIATSVSYDPATGNVTIMTPVPSSPAAQFGAMHKQLMDAKHAVMGAGGVALCKATQGCWDPHSGAQPWAMYLPFGMPLANQLSVTFLDYPPSPSLYPYGDYLNNFTMKRWESVMAAMGIWNHYLYETIIDSRPIAAPGTGQTNYLPDPSTYFNAAGTDHFYITPMISLLADPPSNTSATTTRPVTVLGTPARKAWGAIVGKTVNVLDVGVVSLGTSKNTPWVAGNHPDVTSYQCCPGDPNSACGTPPFQLLQDEQIDFQVLCITQLLAANPSMAPTDAKAACYQSWGQAMSSLPPANQNTLCVQSKMDYEYKSTGQCKTQQDAQNFCAYYKNNPCPTNVYTCTTPGVSSSHVHEAR